MDIKIEKYGKVFHLKDIPSCCEKHIAFAGRSNVGKSSLLNTVLRRKKLAPTSSKPGKTRGLNIYIAENRLLFCDLPGYGYASFSKTQREQFLKLSADYFKAFAQRLFIFVLIDIRRNVGELDLSLLNYAARYNIPRGIVLTKADKVSGAKHKTEITKLRKALDEYSIIIDEENIFLVSVKSKKGISGLFSFIYNYGFSEG